MGRSCGLNLKSDLQIRISLKPEILTVNMAK